MLRGTPRLEWRERHTCLASTDNPLCFEEEVGELLAGFVVHFREDAWGEFRI